MKMIYIICSFTFLELLMAAIIRNIKTNLIGQFHDQKRGRRL